MTTRNPRLSGKTRQPAKRPQVDPTRERLADRKRPKAMRAGAGDFRALFDHSPDAVFLTVPDGRIEAANPAACAMFGMTEAELRRAGRAGLWAAGDPNQAAALEERGRTGRIVGMELTYVRKSGEQFIGETTSVVLPGAPPRAFVLVRDITERKRVELALRRNEAWLAQAVRVAGLGTFEHDHVADRVEVSSVLRDMYGFGQAESVTLSAILARVSEEERETVAAAIRRAHDPAGNGMYEIDCRVRAGDRDIRWVSVRSQTFFEGEGTQRHPVRTIGAVLDITERKRMEAAVRSSERRFRALTERAAELISVVDASGKVAYESPNQPNMLGYPPGALLGRDALELVHPEEQARARSVMQELLAGPGASRKLDTRLRCRDGSWRWVETVGTNLLEEPAVGGIVLNSRDVTARKRTEEALRESEERFRTMADGTSVPIWITNAEGRTRFMNRSACEFAGASVDGAQDFSWQPLLHPEDRARYEEAFRAAMRARQTFRAQARFRRQDGVWRWLESYAEPRFSAGGEFLGMAGSSPDITERKEFQMELERLVAERTAKLRETVGELEHFSYTITHDMRAPLRAMQGFASILLATSANLTPQQQDFIHRIAESAERMDSLITDALSYSKVVRQQFHLEPVDAGALLRGIIQSYPEFQPPRAEVTMVGSIPRVLASKAGLTQCFSNLLGNAVKFVHPGTQPRVRVWAEVRAGERGERQSGESVGASERGRARHAPPAPPARHVRIWFEDNGIGIAREHHQVIFAMFQQLNTTYEGTGIGLALVRKVVERMKGRVGVESEAGQGSRFWLELPGCDGRDLDDGSSLARGG